MSESSEAGDYSMFVNLPDDILITIFKPLGYQELGRLARTCKKFRNIIYSEDTLWIQRSKNVLGSNMSHESMQKRCKPVVSYRDRCRISKMFWCRPMGLATEIVTFSTSMPWILLEKDSLFCSIGRRLLMYQRDKNGNAIYPAYAQTTSFPDDISKFCANENELICAQRDGMLTRLHKHSMTRNVSVSAHIQDILAVDAKDNLIISGSKDCHIKIWRSTSNTTECLKDIDLSNRILSTSILPSKSHFIAGTPGTKRVHPLQLFDLESATLITTIGEVYRYGAGILDIFSESPVTFYTCGYDTTLRLWDIRSPKASVLKWTEPFDNALYCVQTDFNVTMITGTIMSSSFVIWDKRYTRRPVQVHFPRSSVYPVSGHWSSYRGPVYSVAFDATHIYLGCERVVSEYSCMCK